MSDRPQFTVEETFGRTDFIYFGGEFVPWEQARVHLLAPAIQYGASVFEGVRVYDLGDGRRVIFRLEDHLRRLVDSARLYFMDDIGHTFEQLVSVCIDTIRRNGGKGTYIRPCIYRDYGEAGVNGLPCRPMFAVAFWDWGAYLGPHAEEGVKLCTAIFRRSAADVIPPLAKAAPGYGNGRLVKETAILSGYSDSIILDRDGNVSEGSGMNLFFVKKGTLHTPPIGSCILEGVTRDTIIWLAELLGIPVREQVLPMTFHLSCQEVFACGTASEVTPVTQIDHWQVSDGEVGPITRRIRQAFFDLVLGRVNRELGSVIEPPEASWLTHVDLNVPSAVIA